MKEKEYQHWFLKWRKPGQKPGDADVVPKIFDTEEEAMHYAKNVCTEPGEYTAVGFSSPPGMTHEQARALAESFLTGPKQ